MKTLAIIAQKGGSGKTTVAVHMAACAAQQNLKTAIIDIDPQRSAFLWNESRAEDRKLDAVAADISQLADLLQQAESGGVELAIIDTAPHSSAAAAIAAKLADYVLIPCRPARFDLDAIAATLELPKQPILPPPWLSMRQRRAGVWPRKPAPRSPARVLPSSKPFCTNGRPIAMPL